MIHGGNATIRVRDLDRAIRFYTETLGLKLRYRAGNEWAEVDAGKGLVLGLHPTGSEGSPAGGAGSISVGFDVDESLDAVVATLRDRGVVFRGAIPDRPEEPVRLALFSDPDGNDLYLCETKRS